MSGRLSFVVCRLSFVLSRGVIHGLHGLHGLREWFETGLRLAKTPELLDAMSKKAIEKANEYSPEEVAKEYLALFAECL